MAILGAPIVGVFLVVKVEHRWVGGGVASRKWWERPARQTEGTNAISIREGGDVCLSMHVFVRDGSGGMQG